jgi:hypothetical protein
VQASVCGPSAVEATLVGISLWAVQHSFAHLDPIHIFDLRHLLMRLELRVIHAFMVIMVLERARERARAQAPRSQSVERTQRRQEQTPQVALARTSCAQSSLCASVRCLFSRSISWCVASPAQVSKLPRQTAPLPATYHLVPNQTANAARW